MKDALAESYERCQRLARRNARNFYYSFLVLPQRQRKAMCALYAFLRETDELGDSDEPVDVRKEKLDRWRVSLDRALQGDFDDPLFPALVDTVEQFEIPVEYLTAVLDGMEMDLAGHEYETFDDLALYCHRVASVVGLCCVHIWGFRGGEQALEPARRCGIAFQLTNILRDVKEDLGRGRIYLPREDFVRFEYRPEDLQRGNFDDRYRALMQFEIQRAREFYREGIKLAEWIDPAARPTFQTMVQIYHGLLNEIERRQGDVFRERVRLSSWRKLRIAVAAWMGWPRDAAQWIRAAQPAVSNSAM